jgi:hypothetical protein
MQKRRWMFSPYRNSILSSGKFDDWAHNASWEGMQSGKEEVCLPSTRHAQWTPHDMRRAWTRLLQPLFIRWSAVLIACANPLCRACGFRRIGPSQPEIPATDTGGW